jgi:hypothetical protein
LNLNLNLNLNQIKTSFEYYTEVYITIPKTKQMAKCNQNSMKINTKHYITEHTLAASSNDMRYSVFLGFYIKQKPLCYKLFLQVNN